jgi:feruloyl esterase
MIKPIRNGTFRTATRYVPANGKVPAFCQVSGGFVTNSQTGKTANFIATFPSLWNGKYLQLGCSSHCGQFFVSDPAVAAVTVTAQGYPGLIIEKGYATFATDEGHESLESASWALKDGKVDQNYVDDFLFRASKVLSSMGKEYTTAFYARVNGASQSISRSYFQGCSGGGRDAMVATSYFPEAFDGIIAGSPYNPAGMTLQASAVALAAKRSSDAGLSPQLLALFDRTVKAQCDGLDGVKDGLIQNPAACNFVAERDLPRCTSGSAAGQCFTQAQLETASVMTSAVTDENGNVIQPGYSVSELAVAPTMMAMLSDPALKILVNRNDPAFNLAGIFSFRRGGPGSVTAFHAVVPVAEAIKVREALRSGAGHLPENMGNLTRSNTKLLMWHNSSDEALTPHSSVNWYKTLARNNGGYARVQSQARLFMLPGTSHCSISGIAPNSFDPLSAMENWVEKGEAPDSLTSWVVDRQYTPGAPKAPALATPAYSMPLCKFPEMARYNGKGDFRDSKNWSCRTGDTRMLRVGASGVQGGVAR